MKRRCWSFRMTALSNYNTLAAITVHGMACNPVSERLAIRKHILVFFNRYWEEKVVRVGGYVKSTYLGYVFFLV